MLSLHKQIYIYYMYVCVFCVCIQFFVLLTCSLARSINHFLTFLTETQYFSAFFSIQIFLNFGCDNNIKYNAKITQTHTYTYVVRDSCFYLRANLNHNWLCWKGMSSRCGFVSHFLFTFVCTSAKVIWKVRKKLPAHEMAYELDKHWFVQTQLKRKKYNVKSARNRKFVLILI